MGVAFFQSKSEAYDAPPASSEKLGLAAILLGAFVLRASVPFFFPNIHHPDEVFQYLEQGHRIAFGYGVMPWEYRVGIRSWMLPGFLGGLLSMTAYAGGGVVAYLAVVGAAMSAISSSAVLIAWLWGRRIAGPAAAITAAIIAATWFELIYFGSKPLTEVLAASTLFAAGYFLCSRPEPTSRAFVVGGFLLGLTFVLRLHLAPAILLVGLLACVGTPLRVWLLIGVSGATVVATSGVLDWVTWGQPFQSMWKNFFINVSEARADRYGVFPWYSYVTLYVGSWSGAIVPLAALVLLGARRAPIALAVPLVIVLSHSFIGHKEMRFLYPALPFLLLAAAIGAVDFAEGMSRVWKQFGERTLLAVVVIGWVATSLVLSVGGGFRLNWTKSADRLEAFADIRNRAALCGLGLVDLHWSNTGGYVHLHRNVPIYPTDIDTLKSVWNAFDVALAPRHSALLEHGFRRGRCYSNDVCLYERAGECAPRLDRAINSYLRKTDQ